jgi:hypothetical protein
VSAESFTEHCVSAESFAEHCESAESFIEQCKSAESFTEHPATLHLRKDTTRYFLVISSLTVSQEHMRRVAAWSRESQDTGNELSVAGQNFVGVGIITCISDYRRGLDW